MKRIPKSLNAYAMVSFIPGLELAKGIVQGALEELDLQIDQIKSMASNGARTEEQPPKRKRIMSAAARKRISETQKARWAKYHGEKTRQLSPKGSNAVAKATKERWRIGKALGLSRQATAAEVAEYKAGA